MTFSEFDTKMYVYRLPIQKEEGIGESARGLVDLDNNRLLYRITPFIVIVSG